MQHITKIWNSVSDLASDLKRPYTTVHSWFARGSIPPKYDLDLIRLAKKRGKKLTLVELAKARGKSTDDVTHNASTVDVNHSAQGSDRKNHAGAAT